MRVFNVLHLVKPVQVLSIHVLHALVVFTNMEINVTIHARLELRLIMLIWFAWAVKLVVISVIVLIKQNV